MACLPGGIQYAARKKNTQDDKTCCCSPPPSGIFAGVCKHAKLNQSRDYHGRSIRGTSVFGRLSFPFQFHVSPPTGPSRESQVARDRKHKLPRTVGWSRSRKASRVPSAFFFALGSLFNRARRLDGKFSFSSALATSGSVISFTFSTGLFFSSREGPSPCYTSFYP